MSSASLYQIILLMILSTLGNHITVSYIILLVRRHYFSLRFEDIIAFNKAQRLREESRCLLDKSLASIEADTKQQSRLSTVSSVINPLHRRRVSTFSVRSAPDISKSEEDILRCRRRSLDTSNSQSSEQARQLVHQFRSERQGLQPEEHQSTGDIYAAEDSFTSDIPPDDSGDHNGSSISDASSSNIQDYKQHDLYHINVSTIIDGQPIVSSPQAIAFAENIEKQREIARERLEQERRFEGLLQKIAGDDQHGTSSIDLLSDIEDEDEETLKIMREPIDKSQLTRKQRYRLGGAEYRAIDMLTRLVPIYYFGFIIIFAFLLRIYVACSSYAQEVLRTANDTGPLDPWLFSFFTSLSAMNNFGLTLTDGSLWLFRKSPTPLILIGILVLVGNTAYALLLRFIIWCLYKCTPSSRALRRETFRYLLDHPRRCYTLLFPHTQTRWLLFTLVVINIVQIVSFLVLNYWLPVLEDLSWGERFLDACFQSVSTRNAAFTVVNLMSLNPGSQIVYIVAMYISVYPVTISMRNSNVYQERALGIYRTDDNDFDDNRSLAGPGLTLKRYPTMNSVMTSSRKVLKRPDFFVITQVQRQLTTEICWLILGVIIICIIEANAILEPSPITIWSVLYECVSAFGNVGASLGYPDTFVSQSAEYHTLSKLVIILLMCRGRHRGLPAAIDRAVLLPSEQLEQQDVQENIFRRRNTFLSHDNTDSLSSTM
ncbi:low affinity potassium transporter [Apophysomyces sp. BC1015]|nr:low affinity potassium transporter [Apophysomyces sp. BC1015]